MPLVKIYLREGHPREFLQAVGEEIHSALVETANVPADDRFQTFIELGDGRMVAHPSYGGVSRTSDLLIIEITLNQGRTVEVKKALYGAIAARLARNPGVRPDDVLVSLVEVTKENWSFGGGRATYA